MSNKKKPSVAAFMFLPQFRLCFQGLAHVLPIFMRTLGLMFEQAGLIAQNHPATRYGEPGVPKVGFSRMIGEAWVTLKTTRASPYQWGLFSAVVFTVGTVGAALVMTLATVGFGFGAAAQAQLFSIPAGATDNATVPVAPAGMVFDSRTPCTEAPGPLSAVYPDYPCNGNGHDDFAIMLLDKMLRQGMNGTGGYLQNAMQTLMETYNSGVLVVAGIMLFWAILTVVVDTAKTGTVGGGRHNMVWAPIRIVFALGIMIPLGANGFSSGQYMVVKLAEWGSNLATNAWQRYLGSIIGQSLVAGMFTANPTELVQSYSNMWLCRVSYNALQWQAVNTGGGQSDIPASQLVTRVTTEGVNGVTPTWEYSFTNQTTGNLCGSVTIPFFKGDQNLIAAAVKGTYAASMLGMPVMGTDPIQGAITDYKVRMILAYSTLFVSPTNSGKAGTLDPIARAWACDFANQHIYNTSGPNPMVASEQCQTLLKPDDVAPFPIGVCGGGVNTGNGPYPNQIANPPKGMFCPGLMVKTFTDAVQAAQTGATNTLASEIAKHIKDVDRGWADMGRWFLQIGEANKAVKSMAISPITVQAGNGIMQRVAQDGMSEARSQGFLAISQQEFKMMEIQQKATDWWKLQATMAAKKAAATVQTLSVGGNASSPIKQLSNVEVAGGSGPLGWANKAMSILMNPLMIGNVIIDMILDALPISAPSYVLSILQPNDPDIYPYTHVVQIGYAIFTIGWTLIKISAAITIAVSVTQVGGMPMITLVSGPLGSLLTTIGSTMMMAGAALQYWLPVLPFIRVAFSVMTWMVSVFEAVVMVPIAALSHISTEGDGLVGGAKQAWILWLNVLLRPVLTVVGYVGGIMVFNSFVAYFHEGLRNAVVANYAKGLGIEGLFSALATALVYVVVIYTVANSSFKMLDVIPNALMRWMGGHADHSFDDHSAIGGMVGNYAGNVTSNLGRSMNEGMQSVGKQLYDMGSGPSKNEPGAGVQKGEAGNPTSPGGGLEGMTSGSGSLTGALGKGDGGGGTAATSSGGANMGMSAGKLTGSTQGGNQPSYNDPAPPKGSAAGGGGGGETMSSGSGSGFTSAMSSTTGGGGMTSGTGGGLTGAKPAGGEGGGAGEAIKPSPIIGVGDKKPPDDKGGGGGSGGGSGPLFSDRRLKTDIRLMGQENGFDVYAFSYLGDARRFVGVMADDILGSRPDAVSMIDGYMAVDYGKIGVKFRQIKK